MQLVITILAFLAIASALIWFLIATDQGKKEPVTALWIVFGLGIIGVIASVLLEHNLIPARDLSLVVKQPLTKVILATLAVGVIEESCKFLPAAFYLWRKPFFRDHVDGVIFFALAGLAFGIPENILYTIQFGAKTGVARLLMDPIFHASTTGMIGYFLGKAKVDQRPLAKTGLAFLAAILLHAIFDFGLMSDNHWLTMLSMVISVSLAAGLFVFFMRAKELDRQEGLVAVGKNNFCRNCGSVNSHHSLFCIHCGIHA